MKASDPYLIRVESHMTDPRGRYGSGFVGHALELDETRVFGWLERPPALGATISVIADHFAIAPQGCEAGRLPAVPVLGLAAWYGLREAGYLRPGQSVWIVDQATPLGAMAKTVASVLGAGVARSQQELPVDLVFDPYASLRRDQARDLLRDDGSWVAGWSGWRAAWRIAAQWVPFGVKAKQIPFRPQRSDLEDLADLIERSVLRF